MKFVVVGKGRNLEKTRGSVVIILVTGSEFCGFKPGQGRIYGGGRTGPNPLQKKK